jgi:hypothetical protein
MKYALKREYIYGWDYAEFDEDEKPILYDTKEDAEEELQQYIKDVNHAHAIGDMSEPYQNDLIIEEV